MVKYSTKAVNPTKSAQARGSHLRVHFKNCREVGAAIKGKTVGEARTYLEAVLERKAAIPFRRFAGGCGRHAQAKPLKAPGDQVGWPVKAVKFFLDLVTNVAANAEMKGLEGDNLVLTHVQVNRAPQMRRRTYRAHGRIGPYMCNPAHIELIVSEPEEQVKKAADEGARKITRKQAARIRLRSGAKA
uniref:50S ribosomal protein L22, chloroplastic n=1 Tax=Bicosoecida sp. CB-2014 TaxID=1486930 RepID=A0A7S1CK57_9STRA|mmetsp:Transcript_4025/g.14948  ORF Transcript_4025/g.14948 Transcript_4025/m.14948 type:complete len:187 (+) Transcript_4025:56-616(+)|eukprot:CAMPEP_0203810558 /NCGR_PEP_ID=MMETSP0115-20131106/3007_1 /ASSEMBLY_ACC=CAM_ASM_000227 /TAXON_ID=33651 /ORGANISM="Bicosoecid sp, Strain ms1" /LENGTH=186 /DNA_ID=CAMNT_0050719357 /DNA_START=65 /DNA_END=625 /DNA_ORIENTATION=+